MKFEKTKEEKLYDYLSSKYKKAVLTKSELAIELGVGKFCGLSQFLMMGWEKI